MNIATFKPRGSMVLVRRLKVSKEDTGGIIIPGGEYGNYAFAVVLALGPGNATVSHVGLVHNLHGKPADTRYMGETADLTVGDLVVLKVGQNANPLRDIPRVDLSLPFTVGDEKVELVGEGMIVAIITKSE